MVARPDDYRSHTSRRPVMRTVGPDRTVTAVRGRVGVPESRLGRAIGASEPVEPNTISEGVIRGPHLWLNWQAMLHGQPARTSSRSEYSPVILLLRRTPRPNRPVHDFTQLTLAGLCTSPQRRQAAIVAPL